MACNCHGGCRTGQGCGVIMEYTGMNPFYPFRPIYTPVEINDYEELKERVAVLERKVRLLDDKDIPGSRT